MDQAFWIGAGLAAAAAVSGVVVSQHRSRGARRDLAAEATRRAMAALGSVGDPVLLQAELFAYYFWVIKATERLIWPRRASKVIHDDYPKSLHAANTTPAPAGDILKLLRDVLDEVHSLVTAIHFSTTSRQHILAGALLGRILEIAEGVYATLERRDSACGYILLRSLLEVHMDLRILEKDPGYDEFMHAAWLSQQKSILERAVEKGSVSPFLKSIAGEAGARELLDEVRAKLLEFKNQEVKPLSIREKFDKAGQLDYYEGPYNDLSWNTHSNVNVLEKRHIRFANGGVEIRAFSPISAVEMGIISDTTAGIVANSVVAAKSIAAEGATDCDLSRLTLKLREFRAALQHHD